MQMQSDMQKKTLRIGIIGLGTVGAEVARALVNDNARFAAAAGCPVQWTAAAVRNTAKDRGLPAHNARITTDAMAVAIDPEVDIVVEVAGGIEDARTWLLAALKAGKTVVSANKAVLATHGPELSQAAVSGGGTLLCEAAAVGAVPIVRAIRSSLAGDRITEIAGILNGTCNYILSQMTQRGAAFEDALAEAQRLGFAEADPTSDVSGEDAAFKLALLASFAFGATVDVGEIATTGIDAVSVKDIAQAAELGHVIKQIGLAQVAADGSISAHVAPSLLPNSHPLASVSGSFNAVWLRADRAGELMLLGRGAGGAPTASAVLGDLATALKHFKAGAQDRLLPSRTTTLRSEDERRARHYCRICVADRPGVLAQIAGVFGRNGVSIETFVQKGRLQDPVDLVFITHECRAGDLDAALEAIAALDVVSEVAVCMALLEGNAS